MIQFIEIINLYYRAFPQSYGIKNINLINKYIKRKQNRDNWGDNERRWNKYPQKFNIDYKIDIKKNKSPKVVYDSILDVFKFITIKNMPNIYIDINKFKFNTIDKYFMDYAIVILKNLVYDIKSNGFVKFNRFACIEGHKCDYCMGRFKKNVRKNKIMDLFQVNCDNNITVPIKWNQVTSTLIC